MHSPWGRIMKFRTRLFAAAGVSAMLFGGVTLLAMQSADSRPMNGTDAPHGPAVACAQSIEHDGYYQTEYAARLRCDPAVAVAQ
jgi:hypothetical protein